MKKYEENQLDTELKMKYKIVVKTGEAQFAGTDCNVSLPNHQPFLFTVFYLFLYLLGFY